MKRKELKIKLVFQTGEKLKTDSLIVAKVFERRHDNLIRDIRNIIESDAYQIRIKNGTSPNFELCYKINKLANNKRVPYYEMDRQGFEILAMGFTGEKALEWKFKYSDAFAAMEAELRNQASQPYMPHGYPQMLEIARNDWKSKRNELIQCLSDHLQIWDRKRKSLLTDLMYMNILETRAAILRNYFGLTQPNQLTRDWLHQYPQEALCELECRLIDGIMSGSINNYEELMGGIDMMAPMIRTMKEFQTGRVPLPNYAFPIINSPIVH